MHCGPKLSSWVRRFIASLGCSRGSREVVEMTNAIHALLLAALLGPLVGLGLLVLVLSIGLSWKGSLWKR